MRRFTDAEGRTWDVVLGRESWGTMCALFVPAGDGEVRQAVLGADSFIEAQTELDGADDQALQVLLERSSPKTS